MHLSCCKHSHLCFVIQFMCAKLCSSWFIFVGMASQNFKFWPKSNSDVGDRHLSPAVMMTIYPIVLGKAFMCVICHFFIVYMPLFGRRFCFPVISLLISQSIKTNLCSTIRHEWIRGNYDVTKSMWPRDMGNSDMVHLNAVLYIWLHVYDVFCCLLCVCVNSILWPSTILRFLV